MQAGRIIRKQLKALESQVDLVEHLRDLAKTEGGRTTRFGRAFIAAAKDAKVKQAYVARLLEITPGAISQHYNK